MRLFFVVIEMGMHRHVIYRDQRCQISCNYGTIQYNKGLSESNAQVGWSLPPMKIMEKERIMLFLLQIKLGEVLLLKLYLPKSGLEQLYLLYSAL